MKTIKTNKLLFSAIALSSLISNLSAGAKVEYNDGKSSVEIFNMMQIWGMNTIDNGDNDYEESSDLYIRRGRIGVKGKHSDLISYKVWFAYDNLGKANNNILMGSPQESTNSNKDFYIWDAYFTYGLDKEFANMTIGYVRPQVGRESITSGFTMNSYEKGLSNFYLRAHLVGRGPGREVGVNVGGLTLDNKLNYNFGIFHPNHSKITGSEMSVKDGGIARAKATDNASWMMAGRVAYSFGDAEMKKYKIGYTTTYFGKRNGTTIGLNYARQGSTDRFKSNEVMSVDLLSNYGALNLSYEYDLLGREFSDGTEYEDKVQTLRIGYNIPISNGDFLEPAVLWSEADLEEGTYARSYSTLAKKFGNGTAGSQTVTSLGLNWYRNKMKEKYAIHYVNFDKTDDIDMENSAITVNAQYMF